MAEESGKPAARPTNIPLLSSVHDAEPHVYPGALQSPVGEGLQGLRYIDDAGSQVNVFRSESVDDLDLRLNPSESGPLLLSTSNSTVTQQPNTAASCYPANLAPLLDTGQIVVHLGNLRQNVVIRETAPKRMEIIDEMRRVLYHVEQDEDDLESKSSFRFRIYNRDTEEAIQVFSPGSSTCVCCGASWHCLKKCRFQAIVYSPTGVVAGFVRRSRTRFVQEFQILNANEEPLLILRGGPQDLEIYSLDLENELGRLSVHGWVGIMHEVRRTSADYGMTFPIDLDVRVKAVLIGAIFAIHWLYSTKGGKKK